jgi:hypothetical protein
LEHVPLGELHVSLAGKILTFLNVLGAIILFWLAAKDLGIRQQWEYAVFRDDLAINGLPLDEEEHDAQGRPLHTQLGNPKEPGTTLKELFPSGSPVTTQTQEVNRVKGELDSKIQGAGGEAEQTKMRVRILLPLAETNGEREQLLRFWAEPVPAQPIPNQQTPAEITTALYAKAFEKALATEKTGPDGPRSELERRGAIAHLLLNTAEILADEQVLKDPNVDPWELPAYIRVLNVVGFQAAVRELSAQGQLLAGISRDLSLEMERERTTFVAAHQDLLDHLFERSEKVKELADRLARLQEQVRLQTTLVESRKKDVAEVEQNLADARKETDDSLKELRGMGAALHQKRIEVRDAEAKNLELVKKIIELEKGR